MTGLGDVPRLPGRSLSRFYAIKELRMMGSCMCHGHANRCLPDTQNSAAQDSVQVRTQLKVLTCGRKSTDSAGSFLNVNVVLSTLTEHLRKLCSAFRSCRCIPGVTVNTILQA